MGFRSQLAGFANALLRRKQVEEELDEELQSYLEMAVEKKINAGMTPEEAKRAASVEFGGVNQVKEQVRDVGFESRVESVFRDIHYGLRVLAKRPGFTTVVVLTLALGIGANTAIFSVVNAVLLDPFPYPDADRLVRVQTGWQSGVFGPVSTPEYLDYREQGSSFEELALYRSLSVNLSIDSADPERVFGVQASTELFQVLRSNPFLGRTFVPDDGIPGADRVALISFSTWRRKFGADLDVVGQQARLEGVPFTIVGVMPEQFYFPDGDTDVWVPLAANPERAGARGAHNRQVVGRLKSEVTLSEAQVEMAAISERLVAEYPQNYPEEAGFTARVRPLHEPIVENSRPAVLALMAAVGFVLLIACANVASLFLARGAGREKEMALRAAMGARRPRLIRQLVTETLVVALLGGATGLALAFAGIEGLRVLDPGDIPRFEHIGIDARMVAFTFGLTLITGLLFGLVPAVAATRSDPNSSLNGGARVSGLTFARRVRGSLVVLETAVALVLMIGAGLMVRSFFNLVRVDSGLNPRQVTAASVSPSAGRYTSGGAVERFYATLIDDLRNQPGVDWAGSVSVLPFSGSREDFPFGVEGQVTLPGEVAPAAEGRVVAGDYFKALGIPSPGRSLFRRDGHRGKSGSRGRQSVRRRKVLGEGGHRRQTPQIMEFRLRRSLENDRRSCGRRAPPRIGPGASANRLLSKHTAQLGIEKHDRRPSFQR